MKIFCAIIFLITAFLTVLETIQFGRGKMKLNKVDVITTYTCFVIFLITEAIEMLIR